MKAINKAIEKAATTKDKEPSFERPQGEFTDPHTHEYHMAQIFDYTSHNEVTLPVVLEKAEGAYLWDVTGKKYIDLMSSYGCANQGHAHPKIIDALIQQASKLAVTAIVTDHNVLGPASKHLTERLGYDKILFMNSGAEAVDTAVLTARKWGYEVKKIPDGQATVLFPKQCYWGMISSARAGTDDPARRNEAGPLATVSQRYDFVTFDDVEELEAKFQTNPNICAYIFEPIQGHAGNIHPKPGYYTKVRELCTKYNVLMVADEVQAGLGRTGKLFTCDWENVRPDMITLGKSLSGDTLPVSALLADNKIMNVWLPGTHVSTYAGNSVACAVAVASVDVLFDEKLIENAERLGRILEEEVNGYKYPFIKQKNIGRGLFASIQVPDDMTCWKLCSYMLEHGVLVKPGSGGYLKIMPPLCITEADFREVLKILKNALEEYDKSGRQDV